MGNKKYIFKFECGDKLPFNGDNKYKGVKKVKLVEDITGENTPKKEIEFRGCYFGYYGTFTKDEKEKFRLFVHRIKDGSVEEAYLSNSVDLERVKAEVTLDNQCQYTIALSLDNNEWITLPKSSLWDANNDNLKKYYGKDLNLSIVNRRNYIKYNEETVCELPGANPPVCLEYQNGDSKIETVVPQNDIQTRPEFNSSIQRLIIEKDNNNKLSIYLSDTKGNVLSDVGYLNPYLTQALLENSNIREVLPELEIDDDVSLVDTRQLKCWVNKESTIQKIAKDPTLQEGVAAKLREDPGNAKGEKGVSPDVGEIATKLITEKREEFGQMVLDATDGSGKNLATQVASKVNFKPEDFVNKVDEASLTTGIVSKLTSAKAEEFVEKIVNTVISNIHKNNPNSPDFRQDERFAEKLAELLFDRSKMSTKGAEDLIRQKVDKWGLAKYLLLHSGLHQEQEALKLTKEKLDKETLVNALLELAGFQTRQNGVLTPNTSKAEQKVQDIVSQFLSDEIIEKLVTTKADQLGQAILNVKKTVGGAEKPALETDLANNSEFQASIASNRNLQAGVAEELRKNPGKAKGEDGISPDVNSIAQELITKKANELSQAILDVKKDGEPALAMDLANNENLQKSVAGNLKNDGGVDVSKIVDSLKPKFTLQKGKELSQGIYEAKVILDDKVIATLPKIGYYMLDDQLVMYNYATQEKVVIPEEFHYLKVVRLGSGFGNDDYKLTFCNTMGNEFFEYKKYDPEYSRVPDEYKFISLSHAKKEYNPNLSELISHRPLFFIAKGSVAPGPDKYAATVFELTRNGKGKKMATLINEFGYFNQNDQFMHCNYHEETKCCSYTPTTAKIDEKYQVTDADSEFYLTEYDNIAIHAIPEL